MEARRLPRECLLLILMNALFHGGRLIVGANSALYILARGLDFADIAVVKSVQAFVFISLDLPLGLVMKKVGERLSMAASVLAGILGVFIYLRAASLPAFMIAEGFLAVSLSIWPIAFGSYAIQVLHLNHAENHLVDRFFHLGDAISNGAVLLLGTCGALLFGLYHSLPYIGFLATYVGLLLLLPFAFTRSPASQEVSPEQPRSLYDTQRISVASIAPYALLIFALQFFIQPLLHYWQPHFATQFSPSPFNMSLVFTCYTSAMITISFIYSRATRHLASYATLVPFIAGAIAAAGYLALATSKSFFPSLFCFSMTFAASNLGQVSFSTNAQRYIKSNDRMNVLKQLSFIGRIGMMSSLLTSGWLLRNGLDTTDLFASMGLLGLLAYPLLMVVFHRLWKKFNSTAEKLNHKKTENS